MWTAASRRGITYSRSNDVYYSNKDGNVETFNFITGAVIGSAGFAAVVDNGALVCDSTGDILFTLNPPSNSYQITFISNTTTVDLSTVYSGGTSGMAYTDDAPVSFTTSPLTTSPVISASTGSISTGSLTTSPLTTGLVPVPNSGVLVSIGGLVPQNSISVVPIEDLATTNIPVFLTNDATEPTGIFYNVNYNSSVMFYVNPGDNYIWTRNFIEGTSTVYSQEAISDGQNLTLCSYFALQDNGTLYCKYIFFLQ